MELPGNVSVVELFVTMVTAEWFLSGKFSESERCKVLLGPCPEAELPGSPLPWLPGRVVVEL